ncbi:MAG: hypothetical protein N5P05_000002 [Chroococcopsis gigantea SAG 12.99]|jgi:hypothetical protein|nr:hypothetical protein [Chroococcopsis gigantea SAG 12.99]
MENTVLNKTFKDGQGNIVIAQPPNLPIILGIGATLLKYVAPAGNFYLAVDMIAFGSLFTWAWLELFEGVNYFRRGLGLVVLFGLILTRLKW